VAICKEESVGAYRTRRNTAPVGYLDLPSEHILGACVDFHGTFPIPGMIVWYFWQVCFGWVLGEGGVITKFQKELMQISKGSNVDATVVQDEQTWLGSACRSV
jgi:hypothetical protein